MNRMLAVFFAAGLLLVPFPAMAASDASSKPPPVAQKLVREGDFAYRLAARLKLGSPKNEAEAESLLIHAGISPKNGWISDYPVTPEVMVQVQGSVKAAAKRGNIHMKPADADRAFLALGSELGIAATTGKKPRQARAYAPPETDVDDYYEDEGPPVVTYYPPPPDYYYLYDWEPWPFWWYGFWFPGFFVLADFSFVVVVNSPGVVVVGGNTVIIPGGVVVSSGTSLVVTNHVIDPVTRTTVKFSPSGRFVSGATAWHGDAVTHANAPRPASMGRLSRSAFMDRVKSGKGEAAILSRSTTRQGASSPLTGTRPSRGGAVSKGHNETAPSRRGHESGGIQQPRSGHGREYKPGRSETAPRMGGERPSSGGHMSGSPGMGGGHPSGPGMGGGRPSGPGMGGGRPSGGERMGVRPPGGGGCWGRNC